MKLNFYDVTISSGDGREITINLMLDDKEVKFIKRLDSYFNFFSKSINRPHIRVELSNREINTELTKRKD